LAAHPGREKMQTFEQFRSKWQPILQTRKVYILPLGNLSNVDIDNINDSYPSTPSISQLAKFARAFFALDVIILPPLILTQENKDHYVFVWKDKSYPIQKRINGSWIQLYTRDINDTLYAIKQTIPDAFCITSLTMYDLYPDPSWNFVFGQARPKQSVGIFSFIRYGDYFYNYQGKPLKVVPDTVKLSQEEYKLFLKRSLKVMFHETCHMFGMEHCCYFRCPMNGSNHLEESDSRPMFLCPMDLHKLQYRIGFDIIERYRELESFFQQYNELFPEEIEWIQSRLQLITLPETLNVRT